MFSCREATDLLTEESEGALHGGRRAAFWFHLFVCFDCRRFRKQVAQAIDVAKAIPPEPVPQETEDRLAAAFRARRGG